jgi:HEAT repeat protein
MHGCSLKTALADENAPVRGRAAIGLEKIGVRQGTRSLVPVMPDKNFGV